MADIDKSLPNVEQEIKVPSPEELEVAEQEKQQEVNEQGEPVEITENDDGSVDINYNTVKTVKLEKTNGRHRQGSTKRAKKNS